MNTRADSIGDPEQTLSASPAEWRIARPAMQDRIDRFLIARLDPAQETFRVSEMRPVLTPNRLDLAIKLFYLSDRIGRGSRFAGELYDVHLRAFSLGTFREPGNLNKTNLADFHRGFDDILSSLATTGFDARKSLVPVATDGSIVNGAHRTACAIHLGKPIRVLHTGLDPVRYDADFFRARGLGDDLIEAAVVNYVENAPDAAVALVWPAADGYDEEIEAALGPLVYRKAISLNSAGGHTLLSQVYAHEPWLGDPARNYPGIRGKWERCFASGRALRVFVFENTPERSPVATKACIRDHFGIGKDSIHITDTHGEAVALARILLNERSVHFLNHGRPTHFPSTLRAIEGFGRYLADNGIAPSSAAIDSGTVLAAYGIRKAVDVDFIAADPAPGDEEFVQHDATHHGVAVEDLLADPRLHFHYQGVKLLALAQVATMKRRRRRGSDAEDLRAMMPYLVRGGRSRLREYLVCEARLAFARARRLVIRSTAWLGLEHQARTLYRRVMRRGLAAGRTRR